MSAPASGRRMDTKHGRRLEVSDHLQTIATIYEAFGRGDVPGILGCLAEDIQWEYAWTESPVPWLAPGSGHDHVARFFGVLAERLEFNRFEVNHILSEDD